MAKKEYSPSTFQIFQQSILTGILLYVFFLVIFFILPVYLPTVRIYYGEAEIPFVVALITAISVLFWIFVFGLSYLIAKKQNAWIEDNILHFIIRPLIGREENLEINLKNLNAIHVEKKIITTGRSVLTVHCLIFISDNKNSQKVRVFGWDKKTIKDILMEIKKEFPEISINTPFYKSS